MYGGKYLRKILYSGLYLVDGLYGAIGTTRPPCFDKLVQWTLGDAVNGIYEDKVGNTSFPATARVGGRFLSAGTIETGLVSESITYRDATTDLDVVTVTDGSGNFAVPANGLTWLRINGLTFPVNEGTGTIIGSTGGLDYYTVTGATWDISDFVYSYSDDNGYTGVADGSTMYWDIGLTQLIAINSYIPYGSGFDTSGSLEVQYEGPVRADLIECDVTGTPTTGGLYVKQYTSPSIYRIASVTDTLTTDHFGRVDPANLTAVILEKATLPNIDNNQLFTKDSLEEWLLYNTPQTEPCYTNINKYMDLVEPLVDITGDPLFDENGSRLYALKETTERVV